MTSEEVDAEIERSRQYLHALIDKRFALHLEQCHFADAYPDKRGRTHPQFWYLWRSRSEYERATGKT